MAFDETTNTSIATAISDSFNDVEENNLGVTVGVADSFNDDHSTTDSGNTAVGIDGSFNSDFGNTSTDVDDSFNTSTDTHVWTFTDTSETDNSVNAGLRSYDTGFSGVGGAAAGAAGGDVMVNNQNSIVDQSVNQNLAGSGSVWQSFVTSSVSASGDDALAAGGDISVDTYVDQSTSISADGDVLIDSTKNVSWTEDSGNTSNFSYSYEDSSTTIDIDDSFNTHSWETTVTESYNDDSTVFSDTDINVDLDAIVDSSGAAIGDVDFTL